MKPISSVACALAVAVLFACKDEPTGPRLPFADSKDVLLEDDFDDENGGKGVPNYTGFRNWNVVAGCVDLHGNGFHDVQPGNGLYVDLDGSPNVDPSCTAGTLESKVELAFEPGSYLLELWLAGNQEHPRPDTLIASLGNLLQEEFVLESTTPFAQFTRTFQVSERTTARLRFAHSGGDAEGILLDLVRVRRAP